MDPLSIAGAVAGLLSTTAAITCDLHTFVFSAAEAAQSINRVISEVQAVSFTIWHVQEFLSSKPKDEDKLRLSTLSLQDLVTVLSGCVLIFSELERHVDESKGPKGGAWDKVTWGRKEPELEILIEDMQRHKVALDLILSVINRNCTAADAADSVKELHAVMRQILDSHHIITTQLRNLMYRQNLQYSASDGESARSAKSKRASLEAVLKKSGHKAKRLWDRSAGSPAGSTRHSKPIAVASETSTSLAEVPDISAAGLPILPGDIWNAEHYQKSGGWNEGGNAGDVGEPARRGASATEPPRRGALDCPPVQEQDESNEAAYKRQLKEALSARLRPSPGINMLHLQAALISDPGESMEQREARKRQTLPKGMESLTLEELEKRQLREAKEAQIAWEVMLQSREQLGEALEVRRGGLG